MILYQLSNEKIPTTERNRSRRSPNIRNLSPNVCMLTLRIKTLYILDKVQGKLLYFCDHLSSFETNLLQYQCPFQTFDIFSIGISFVSGIKYFANNVMITIRTANTKKRKNLRWQRAGRKACAITPVIKRLTEALMLRPTGRISS